MAQLGAPPEKSAEDVRRDLELTPRWILSNLKQARDEANALRLNLAFVHEQTQAKPATPTDDIVQRLLAELESVKAREASKMQEFVDYARSVEAWKAKVIASTREKMTDLSEQLQDQRNRVAELELQATMSSTVELQKLLEVKDEQIDRQQEQIDALTAELDELARLLRSKMASARHPNEHQRQRPSSSLLLSSSSSLSLSSSSSAVVVVESEEFERLVQAVRSQLKDTLIASGLGLQSLPRSLYELDWLYRVDMHENEITEVPEDIGSLAMLEELSFAFNHLSSFPSSLALLQRLTHLDLAGNQIAKVPDVLGSLHKLQVLDLSRNHIVTLPDSITSLTSLTFLNVSFNQIAALPTLTDGWRALVELHASHNLLTVLPSDLGNRLDSLGALDLSHNQLTAIPASFRHLQGHLQILRLVGNPLLVASLPVEALNQAGSFFAHLEATSLHLTSNGNTSSSIANNNNSSSSNSNSNSNNNNEEERVTSPRQGSRRRMLLVSDSTALIDASQQELLMLHQPSLPNMLRDSSNATVGASSSSRSIRGPAWREEVPAALSEQAVLEDLHVPTLNIYELHFFNVPHVNYIGEDKQRKGCPIVVSIALEVPSDLVKGTYRALVRSQTKDEEHYLPVDAVKRSSKASLAVGKDLVRAFEQLFYPGLTFRPLTASLATDMLLSLEDDLINRCFKFGVLYLSNEAQTENDIYSSTPTSKRWQQFLNIIGEQIYLPNWEHYSGGLDVKPDSCSTGEYSFYSRFEGFEIMYHVCSLLPFSATKLQQVERKRHIGNDVVVIVFVDGQHEFDPTVLTSIFTHVYLVVNVNEVDPATDLAINYRLSVLSKPGVDQCSIPLFTPPITPAERDLRHYIIAKCIALERAAFSAPGFAPAIRRARRELIVEFQRTALGASKTVMLDKADKPAAKGSGILATGKKSFIPAFFQPKSQK